MLWAALLTTPMMAALNGTCARIGMVTGGGLMGTLAKSMPPILAVTLGTMVVLANTFNAGADLAAMAASMHLMVSLPVLLWIVVFSVLIVVGEVFFSYRRFAAIVKLLCVSLLAYVVTAFIVHPPWLVILRSTVVPYFSFRASWMTTLMGTLGTTITPYLFFWQTSMTVEEKRAAGRGRLAARLGATPPEIRSAHADVNSGAIYSNVIMFFIIVTTAATLGAHGMTNIATPQDAATALRPLAGDFAYLLFTVGIIGTGLLAVPVLAGSSAYVLSELFGLQAGLSHRLRDARGFYGVVVAGVAAGMLMSILGLDPILALFWSAVFNGIAAVPLIYAIIRVAGDSRVLGRWRASRTALVWLWLSFALMLVSACGMVASWFIHT
jgi:Mn2+/Fe2+ NRAMP family transporter